ncbi:putative F-box protein At1g23770 [Punica granatum]|uniref:F-box protein At1g23770 n=2 Tax=Punica granatum TaxID=22663 RepID=A0A6P8E7C0_PUNGR|nr:putative F-box protein At1g23770 [Punica granatum]PKI34151.1 hypothetical protein CRG98_045430 [Punica granatum]
MGRHVLGVYGSPARGECGRLHAVYLAKHRFAPAMVDLLLDNGRSSLHLGSVIFEIWKLVKDRLALPLIIDLRERANLPLPSYLMSLLTELKLQTLELLDVHDVLQMAFLSSKFRDLSSDNAVWKQKFLSELRDVKGMQGALDWKDSYKTHCKWKRDGISLKRTCVRVERSARYSRRLHFLVIRWDPVPRISRQDYDLLLTLWRPFWQSRASPSP